MARLTHTVLGIPMATDTVTAQATCTICGGTGWQPTPDRRVKRCDCVLAARSSRLLDAARIPARYRDREFASFHTEFQGSDSSLEDALLIAQGFVREFDHVGHNKGLLFLGPIGVGKTHLAVAVIKELIAKGTRCLFYDYRELLKEIQNSYNASVPTTEMQVLRPAFEADVLVLDELGAMKTSEWVWDTVSLVLNSRYNEKRTTIITTNFPNLPMGGLTGPRASFSQSQQAKAANRDETLGDRIGERMRSRLHEMCRVVEMNGSDFRQSVGKASFR